MPDTGDVTSDHDLHLSSAPNKQSFDQYAQEVLHSIKSYCLTMELQQPETNTEAFGEPEQEGLHSVATDAKAKDRQPSGINQ